MDDKINDEFRKEVREALKDIRADIKVIRDFRGQIIGGALLLSSLVSWAISFWIKNKG